MKTALIIGCRGQDGTLLKEHLLRKRYRVIGIARNGVDAGRGKITRPLDVLKPKEVSGLLQTYKPEEIYYLAAYHHSSEDLSGDPALLLKRSFAVHVDGLLNVLEAVRAGHPRCRIFYAASSHIFGDVRLVPQNESTPMNPDCAYGLTKAAGRQLCRLYRDQYGLFVSVGILYNHESPLRGAQFVSRKIVQAAWAIKQGRQKELILGNLKAKVDWGYAGDYVQAMHRILRLKKPDDFIISSGELHTVGEFTRGVFECLGLDSKRYVKEDPALLKKSASRQFYGDHSKLTKAAGWEPKVSFNELITMMVRAERQEHVR